MPYRSPSTVCIICSLSTNHSCHNCSGLHCPAHLIDGSCAGCVGTLWQIERRQVGVATLLYAVVALPAFFAATLGLGWAFVAPAATGYLVLGSAVRHSVRFIARRRLANRKLLATSVPQPKLLPADNTEYGDGSSRPRPRYLISAYRRRSPRAVCMTRGGHFYQ